jgi:putative FmdB family regulatory protein
MPTYEYQCPACGVVEAFQSMRDAPLVRCPQCSKHKVSRLISGGGGVIFTGSGFWETDYNRSKDYRAKAKDGAAKPAGEAKPAGSEAKPAAAAPTSPSKPAAASAPTGSK